MGYYPYGRTLEERFWAHVVPEPMSGCWLWGGAGNRYGHLSRNNKPYGAHRLAWELYRGPIPKGRLVCHKCDVTICVNPDHLFLGTQLDNRRDAKAKGRVANGERIASAVLTAEIVGRIKEMQRAGQRPTAIARDLGFKRAAISAVVTGRNWSHVQ